MFFVSLLVLKYFLVLDLIPTAKFDVINYIGSQRNFSPTYLRHFQKLLKNLKSSLKNIEK